MATRATIKNNFLTGKNPTQGQFHEWIDSFFHLSEDSLPIQKVTGLQQILEQLSGGTGGESVSAENIDVPAFYLINTLDAQAGSKVKIYTAAVDTILVFPQMAGHKIQSPLVSLAVGKSIKVSCIYLNEIYYWMYSSLMEEHTAKSRYYNGWQHDLPEPDWNKIKTTIPIGAQLIRDIDGNYYCNGGYNSNNYSKYDSNLSLISTISNTGTKYNRNMPHIIVDFLSSGKTVLLMPNYNSATPVINLDNFSINSSLNNGIPSGKFIDNQGNLSEAIPAAEITGFWTGAAAFDLGGGSLWLLHNKYLTNGAANMLHSGKFLQNWRVGGDNTIASSFICAGGNYLCMFDGTKVSVFNFLLLIESGYDFARAYLYSFNHGLAMLNMGYDCYYVYNDKLVIVTFGGAICAFDLNDGGNRVVSLSDQGNAQGAFFWRNKVYRTGSKIVTTLSI